MAIVDELSALRTSTLAAIEQAADTSALEVLPGTAWTIKTH